MNEPKPLDIVRDARRERPWDKTDKAFMRNDRLSGIARMLLMRVLSDHPEHRVVDCRVNAKRLGISLHKARQAMGELIEHGYAVRFRDRQGSAWVMVTVLSDVASDLDSYRNVQVTTETGFSDSSPVVSEESGPDVTTANARRVRVSRTAGSRSPAECTLSSYKNEEIKHKNQERVPAVPAVPRAVQQRSRRQAVRSEPETAIGPCYGGTSPSKALAGSQVPRRTRYAPGPDSAGGLAQRFAEKVDQLQLRAVPEDVETGALGGTFARLLQNGDTPGTIRDLQDAWFASAEARRPADRPQWQRFLGARVRLRRQLGMTAAVGSDQDNASFEDAPALLMSPSRRARLEAERARQGVA